MSERAKHTPLPWHVGPPLRLMGRPHDLLISGDRHFVHEEGEAEDGSDRCECGCDGDQDACDCREGCGWTSVSVAHVLGNETAGGIPRANAERIVRAVNLHDELVAALTALLDCANAADQTRVDWSAAKLAAVKAIAAATGGRP